MIAPLPPRDSNAGAAHKAPDAAPREADRRALPPRPPYLSL